LLIYEQKGTEPQLREFVRLAERQLGVLETERSQMDDTIAELRQQRDNILAELK